MNQKRWNATVISRHRGTSLLEMMVVVTITGILISFAAPSYRKAVEQSKLDLAATNLRSIWAAERFYYLDQRAYTSNFSVLSGTGVLDSGLINSDPFYSYSLAVNEAGTSFTATATRVGSSVYTGSLAIDPSGALTGGISGSGGISMTPGYQ